MPEFIDANIHGIDLQLWRYGGAYATDCNTLFVADTHFGKEATFRRHSIAVPKGSTEGTLEKISAMLLATRAASLVILGDMFHARSSLTNDVCESLDSFFAENRDLHVTLIRGNHDIGLRKLPESWPVEILSPIQRMGHIALDHQPNELPDGANLLFCGHLHPSICVSASGDELRLPCFWLSQQRLVFPAIGEFTGMANIGLTGDDRVWLLADREIIEWKGVRR